MDSNPSAFSKLLLWLLATVSALALQWAAARWLPKESRLRILVLRWSTSRFAFWLLLLVVAAVGFWLSVAYS